MDRGSEDFAAFYERHRDPCFRAVPATVADRHSAEELTAEAFARAWSHWRKVSKHPAPAAWVVRTALNTHVSWWRRRRREVAWDAAAAGRGEAGPADDDATAVDLAIRDALRKLPLRQREVVVLRVFLDLDTRGAAAALGIAPGVIKKSEIPAGHFVTVLQFQSHGRPEMTNFGLKVGRQTTCVPEYATAADPAAH